MGSLFRLLSTILVAGLVAIGVAGDADAAGRRITALDVLRIKVIPQSDLDTEVRVEPAGTIVFAFVGRIKAAGLTEDELAGRIKAALEKADVVKNPQVLVTVTGFGTQVSVQGAVGTPGLYPLDRPTTLTEALAKAGGLTLGAGTVVLRRPGPTGESITRFDAKAILAGKNNDANVIVQNLDSIFVEEAAVYFLYGYVNKPGQYPLTRRLTVQQALAAGGGISELGTSWFIRIKRRLADGDMHWEWVTLDDEVQANDTIIINERIF